MIFYVNIKSPKRKPFECESEEKFKEIQKAARKLGAVLKKVDETPEIVDEPVDDETANLINSTLG